MNGGHFLCLNLTDKSLFNKVQTPLVFHLVIMIVQEMNKLFAFETFRICFSIKNLILSYLFWKRDSEQVLYFIITVYC